MTMISWVVLPRASSDIKSKLRPPRSLHRPPSSMSAKWADQVPSARKGYVAPPCTCHSPTSNCGDTGDGDGKAVASTKNTAIPTAFMGPNDPKLSHADEQVALQTR